MKTAADRIEVSCPACQKKLHAPRAAIGKNARCNSCDERFIVVDDSILPAASLPPKLEIEETPTVSMSAHAAPPLPPLANARLGSCPDCYREVSLRAETCPYCGCPFGKIADEQIKEAETERRQKEKAKRKRNSTTRNLLILFGFLALMVMISNSSGDDQQGMMSFAVWAVIIFAYFLPALVAWERNHHQAGAIAVINLFFGWSGLGWVLALAMAYSHNQNESK